MMLKTERTLLRPFTEGDAEDLYAYAKDPRVGPIAGWKPHGSVEESREIIRTVFAAPNTFAVVERETGRVIGSAGFVQPRSGSRPEAKAAEIGYALHPDWWGMGLMPEVVEELHSHGIEINPYTINDPDDIRDMIAKGVNSVIGNFPDVVNRVRAEQG